MIFDNKNYDGAMGQAPGQESNGGGTYCALASLSLMGRLDDIPNKEALLHWLVILPFLLNYGLWAYSV